MNISQIINNIIGKQISTVHCLSNDDEYLCNFSPQFRIFIHGTSLKDTNL